MCNIINTLAAILAALFAGLAIVFAILIYWRQRKIALYEIRMNIFQKIEGYVYSMQSWEYSIDWFNAMHLYKSEIETLFDKEFLLFYENLSKSSKKLEKLHGDYDYALKHDKCSDGKGGFRTPEQIEGEIGNLTSAVEKEFEELKRDRFKRYFAI